MKCCGTGDQSVESGILQFCRYYCNFANNLYFISLTQSFNIIPRFFCFINSIFNRILKTIKTVFGSQICPSLLKRNISRNIYSYEGVKWMS